MARSRWVRFRPVPVQPDELISGRYRVGDLLGRGGMAEVYDAFDERLHRPVAVKVVRASMAARDDVVRRFEEEARAAASLSHPNVVTVFDWGEDVDGRPFLVMERLPGETLADRVAAGRGEPLDPDWVKRMAGDVLLALGAAHAAGIVHRDIKPGNVLIGYDGCAKVADFGIAKSIMSDGDETTTGMLIGTPAYLAPERIDGDPATPASDIYAVGVLLYEALTGAKPFGGDTPVAIAYAIRHSRPTPLAVARPDLPAALVAAVDRAMSPNPAIRFESAADMLAALDGDGDQTTTAAAAPAADHTLVLEAQTRTNHGARPPVRRIGVALAVVVALLVGIAVALAAGGDPSAPDPPDDPLLDVAAELSTRDGPRAGEAAARLRAVASSDSPEAATALLRDATAWNDAGELGDAAYNEMLPALLDAGADRAALTPTTTAPPTTTTTAAPAVQRSEKGKGKKGDDDD